MSKRKKNEIQKRMGRYRDEFAGLEALNSPYSENVSASRKQMKTNHQSQAIPLLNTTIERILTPHSAKMGEYTFDIRIPTQAMIIKIFNKYNVGASDGAIKKTCGKVVIYQDIETGKYDCVHLVEDWNMHSEYGCKYKLTDVGRNISPGMVVPANTILAKTINAKEHGLWSTSLEAETIYISDPANIEDGVKILDTWAEKASVFEYATHIIQYGKKSYPLDLYGTNGKFQAWPEVGQHIRQDGLVFATRDYGNSLLNSMGMNNKELRFFNRGVDNPVYGTPGAEIIDVTVLSCLSIDAINNTVKPKRNTSNVMMEQPAKYIKASLVFSSSIIAWYDSVLAANKKASFGPELTNTICNAFSKNVHSNRIKTKTGVVKLQSKSMKIDEVYVEIKTRHIKPIGAGAKLTGYAGNKGVSCKIVSKEYMPTDSAGNVADVAFFGGAVVARLNDSQLVNQYLNAASRDLSREIRNAYNALPVKTADSVIPLWNRLISYYEIAAPTKAKNMANSFNANAILNHVQEVVKDGVYLISADTDDTGIVDMYYAIEKDFAPTYGQVTFKTDSGRTITTKDKMLIGPQSMMVLEKTYLQPTAVSMSPLQHHGLLSSASRVGKQAHQIRVQSPSVYSETEVRLYANIIGPECLAEMLDLANNTTAHKELVRNMIHSDTPSNMDIAVDRRKVPTNARNVTIVKHFLTCFGLSIRNNLKE